MVFIFWFYISSSTNTIAIASADTAATQWIRCRRWRRCLRCALCFMQISHLLESYQRNNRKCCMAVVCIILFYLRSNCAENHDYAIVTTNSAVNSHQLVPNKAKHLVYEQWAYSRKPSMHSYLQSSLYSKTDRCFDNHLPDKRDRSYYEIEKKKSKRKFWNIPSEIYICLFLLTFVFD